MRKVKQTNQFFNEKVYTKLAKFSLFPTLEFFKEEEKEEQYSEPKSKNLDFIMSSITNSIAQHKEELWFKVIVRPVLAILNVIPSAGVLALTAVAGLLQSLALLVAKIVDWKSNTPSISPEEDSSLDDSQMRLN